jgi:hypothetical protein
MTIEPIDSDHVPNEVDARLNVLTLLCVFDERIGPIEKIYSNGVSCHRMDTFRHLESVNSCIKVLSKVAPSDSPSQEKWVEIRQKLNVARSLREVILKRLDEAHDPSLFCNVDKSSEVDKNAPLKGRTRVNVAIFIAFFIGTLALLILRSFN